VAIHVSPNVAGKAGLPLGASSVGGATWLGAWLALNVGLTLLNKAVFSFGSFNFPLTLSALHMLITGVLSWVCVHHLKLFPYNPNIDRRGQVFLFLFSFIFSINIVMGNVSIQVVSVALVQVFRAVIPGVTMALSYVILGKSSSFYLVMSMIPICFGVMLTVSGDLDLTFVGLVYTAVGTFLSALKVVVCNKFLKGAYEMHPLDLLARVSPLAFVQTAIMVYLLEWRDLSYSWHLYLDNSMVLYSIMGSGFIAWLLNITNFFTNQKTSPVTLTVGGNVKQILTILLSIVIFSTQVTLMGALGILVTVMGAVVYSIVNHNKW
jgi:drug/metabolite transporter (DMT)-like permease